MANPSPYLNAVKPAGQEGVLQVRVLVLPFPVQPQLTEAVVDPVSPAMSVAFNVTAYVPGEAYFVETPVLLPALAGDPLGIDHPSAVVVASGSVPVPLNEQLAPEQLADEMVAVGLALVTVRA